MCTHLIPVLWRQGQVERSLELESRLFYIASSRPARVPGQPEFHSEILSVMAILFCSFLVFGDKVSLCNPGPLETCSVDQVGLELRDPPDSVS